MRAALDSGYVTTQASVAKLFHASLRTVNDASRRTVNEWLAMLRILPAPRLRPPAKVKSFPTPVPSRPGDRSNAKLEKPENTVEITEHVDFDVPEPVIDDDAIDRARNEALADYDDQARMAPMPMRRRSEGNSSP